MTNRAATLLRGIHALAWPVLVAQLATMALAVIDAVMAGRFSTDDLAAVGIGSAMYVSVFVPFMGVLLAISPSVSQLHGAGELGSIGEEVRQAGWLAAALTVVSIVLFLYPEPLLTLSQVPPEVEAKVRDYLAMAAWGMPAALGIRLFTGYTTAVSLPRALMVLTLAGLAIKVPLNWVLVFGRLGAPPMGAAGCALATSIVNTLMCLAGWAWCALAAGTRPHRVFARFSWPQWPAQRRLLAVGVPIGLTILFDVTAFTFMALLIARLGPVSSAAHQIAANVAAVLYMLPLALGTAVSVLVGQAVGAHRFGTARETGVIGLVVALVLAVLCGTAIALAAPWVVAAYTEDDMVRRLATGLLAIVAVYHVFDALLVVAVSALRGYKRTVVALVCNALGLWSIGLGGGYLIGLTDRVDLSWIGLATPLGVPGLWIGAVTGILVGTIGVIGYYLAVSTPERARRRQREMEGAAAA